jgi:hypothetical protein
MYLGKRREEVRGGGITLYSIIQYMYVGKKSDGGGEGG